MVDELEELSQRVEKDRNRLDSLVTRIKKTEKARNKQSKPLASELKRLLDKQKKKKACLYSKERGNRLEAQIREVRQNIRSLIWDDDEDLDALRSQRRLAISDLRVTEHDLQRMLYLRVKDANEEYEGMNTSITERTRDHLRDKVDTLEVECHALKYMKEEDVDMFALEEHKASQTLEVYRRALLRAQNDVERYNKECMQLEACLSGLWTAINTSASSVATRCANLKPYFHFRWGLAKTFQDLRHQHKKEVFWPSSRIEEAREDRERRENPVGELQTTIAAAIPAIGGQEELSVSGAPDFEPVAPGGEESL